MIRVPGLIPRFLIVSELTSNVIGIENRVPSARCRFSTTLYRSADLYIPMFDLQENGHSPLAKFLEGQFMHGQVTAYLL